ncbi:unnamed protein product [Pylaiella littoralis]
MEVTHAKGTLYPALQLSSFRVRRDSLPPAFELPQEVDRAVTAPLPDLQCTTLAEEALRENQRLLKEDERERKETQAKIAREEALASEELTRIVEETERKKSRESAARARKVGELMSLMGITSASAAERQLEQCGWDYQKAAMAFFETV